MTLSQLQIGKTSKIKSLSPQLNPQFKKRLLAMGLTPNSDITLVRKSPFGGALHIKTSSIDLSIRKGLANQILLAD